MVTLAFSILTVLCSFIALADGPLTLAKSFASVGVMLFGYLTIVSLIAGLMTRFTKGAKSK